MATRYQTYLLSFEGYDEEGVLLGRWGTFDSYNEDMPTEFVAGPFNVNVAEAQEIKEGATVDNYIPKEELPE